MKRPLNSVNASEIPSRRRKGSTPVAERLRALDRTQRHAVLATVSAGQPYTSLVAFALLPDLSGALFATPKDTFKYRNILENEQVALLVDSRSNRRTSYMGAEAVTIQGRAVPVRRGPRREQLAEIFTVKHPDLAGFVQSPTTALVLIEMRRCFHVGRFQTVSQWQREVK